CSALARRRADPAAAALDGWTDPAIRGRGAVLFGVRQADDVRSTRPLVSRPSPEARSAGIALGGRQRRGTTPAVPAARPPHEAAARPHARRDRISIALRGALP